MSSDYYHRFELAYTRFLVRKRVGKRFKVICRFRTYEQAAGKKIELVSKYVQSLETSKSKE